VTRALVTVQAVHTAVVVVAAPEWDLRHGRLCYPAGSLMLFSVLSSLLSKLDRKVN
jgi:hypothetical protein